MLNDLHFDSVKHIYVKPGRTDLRRGIEGLAAIVRSDMGRDPLDGSLFLFCGSRKDRIKGLLYEGDGYLLLYKRVADGRFRWPHNAEEVNQLDESGFQNLMRGLEIAPGIRAFHPSAY